MTDEPIIIINLLLFSFQLWHGQLEKIINNALAANISSLCALEKIFTQIKLMASEGRVPVKR